MKLPVSEGAPAGILAGRTEGRACRALLHLALLASVLSWAGCRTHHPPPPPPAEPPRPQAYLRTLPAEAPAEQVSPPGLEAAVAKVLAAHGFFEGTKLEGDGNRVWVVAPRCGSGLEASLVIVRMAAAGEVTVDIKGFARVGNAWATLGAAFRGPLEREAAEIRNEIERQVRDRAP